MEGGINIDHDNPFQVGLRAMCIITMPSALGMSDPVMEFLEFPEKGKIFWGRGEDFEGEGRLTAFS